ncbi:MAG TPA: hypothetical protein VIL49_00755 [Capillimicrobium sp.]|jgi:hypothetical protein
MVRDPRKARRSRWLGALGLLLAVALPAWMWHGVIADIYRAFQLDVQHLLGWAPWLLLAGGIAFLVPVAWSVGRDPEGRWYPRARNAYAGWGVTLYLLGLGLAAQVARIHDSPF